MLVIQVATHTAIRFVMGGHNRGAASLLRNTLGLLLPSAHKPEFEP